jgi:chromate transporter
LSYCTLLPGPEAQKLAISIGWLMHRTKSGFVAGTLSVLPGMLAIMALSIVYAGWGNLGAVAALFFAKKPLCSPSTDRATRRWQDHQERDRW